MKNKGDTHITTRQEIRRLQQILTFDEYERIVRRIINTAINSDNEKNALQSAFYIIDRIEGKIPSEININDVSKRTLKDLLENNGARDITEPKDGE